MESLFLLFSLSLLSCVSRVIPSPVYETGVRTDLESERIINGDKAQPGQFPYIVRLAYTGDIDSMCTGSFITDKSILTAAHCVTNDDGSVTPTANIQGYFGSVERGVNEIKLSFLRFIVHGEYKPQTTNDVAIITFNVEDKFKKQVRVIALPKAGLSFDRKAVFQVGWGYDKFGATFTSKFLRYTNSNVQDSATCSNKANDNLHVCAVPNNNNACAYKADSGSPAVIKRSTVDLSIGIASYVFSVNSKCDSPDVYVSTSAYHDWINQTAVGQITYA